MLRTKEVYSWEDVCNHVKKGWVLRFVREKDEKLVFLLIKEEADDN